MTVIFNSAWDYDNEMLTYDVIRDNVDDRLHQQVKSNFWTLPNQTFTDTGLAPGSTHTYQVRIKDPFGNISDEPQEHHVTGAVRTSGPPCSLTARDQRCGAATIDAQSQRRAWSPHGRPAIMQPIEMDGDGPTGTFGEGIGRGQHRDRSPVACLLRTDRTVPD